MKSIILFFGILLITIVSCSEDPIDSNNPETFEFLQLPINSFLGDTTHFDIYYQMTGAYAYSVEFNRQFTGGPFGQYEVSAKLLIDSGTIAITDTMTCLLSVGVINTSVLVSPIEQYFAHPFKLTITYTGLDLQNINLTDLQFVYTNEADVILDVTYDAITIDYANGRLEVLNALIEYDARQVPDAKYGWVRKAE